MLEYLRSAYLWLKNVDTFATKSPKDGPLPCPFCGKAPDIRSWSHNGFGYVRVGCLTDDYYFEGYVLLSEDRNLITELEEISKKINE